MDTIRIATPDDAGTLSRIHALSWHAAYQGLLPDGLLQTITPERWAPFFRESLSHNTCEAALIYASGEAAGCIAYGAMRGDVKPDGGEIISLYVLKEYWSSRKGYALLQFALAKLREKGYDKVYVWVLKQNARAIAFYRRCGFAADEVEMHVKVDGYDCCDIRMSMKI